MFQIIWIILAGLVIGSLARLFVPGRQSILIGNRITGLDL